jgi:hypothetical protein
MRRHVTSFLALLMTAGLLVIGVAAPAQAEVRAKRVAGGLDEPVAFTFGPGRHLWYVEKSSGEVRIIDLDTGRDRLFVRVSGVSGEGERGMLGIACTLVP